MSTRVIGAQTVTRRWLGELVTGEERPDVIQCLLFVTAIASIIAIAFM